MVRSLATRRAIRQRPSPLRIGFHVLARHHTQQSHSVGLLAAQLRILDRCDDRQRVGHQPVDQLRAAFGIGQSQDGFALES